MQIALIRHARPQTWHGAGPADPELTDDGNHQAQHLAAYLTRPDAPRWSGVYSSTMRRAIQTAEPFADRSGLTLETVADLVEYDHGMDIYVPTEEIAGDFEEYWANLQAGWYGGRQIDLDAFRGRVVDAIDRIIAAHAEGDLVAIFCHGGVISAYVSSVVANSQPLFCEPDYTSISRVLVNRAGRRQLLSLAETPHRGFAAWHGHREASPTSTGAAALS